MPGADTWSQFPNLTHVNLSHTLGCTAGMLARLARGCPKLSKLNLNNAKGPVTPKGIAAILRDCKNLTDINLTSTGVLLPEVLIAAHPTLNLYPHCNDLPAILRGALAHGGSQFSNDRVKSPATCTKMCFWGAPNLRPFKGRRRLTLFQIDPGERKEGKGRDRSEKLYIC